MRPLYLALLSPCALVQIAAAPAPKTPAVMLASTSLTVGPAATARFGQPRAKALAVIAAALGKPRSGTYPDCGQDIPIGYARFHGGLEITFIAGKFVGWTIDAGGAGMRTARGIGLGSSRAALRKAYPAVRVDADASLGVMFTIDDDLGGFLDSDKPAAKVASLYAGETCKIS